MKRFSWIVFLVTTLYSYNEEILQNPNTHRVLQFENEHVRVWKTTIMPNQPLKMHRHDFPRVVVGLKGGVITKLEENGLTKESYYESGKAYWLREDPADSLHACLNNTEEPIEVMVIEVVKSQP